MKMDNRKLMHSGDIYSPEDPTILAEPVSYTHLDVYKRQDYRFVSILFKPVLSHYKVAVITVILAPTVFDLPPVWFAILKVKPS